MRIYRPTFVLAFATLLLGAGIASADEAEPEARSGITFTAGGGVEDFAGQSMRDSSNLNGLWAVHAAVEVQRHVTLEAGYIGTAAKINAPIGNDAATLVGSTFEAIGRLSPLPDAVIKPYAFFGAAWRHYEVGGEDFTTADFGMEDSDDLFQIPVGAGLGYRYAGLVVDARFTYRPTTGESLLLESDGEYAPMETWGMSAALGYEF